VDTATSEFKREKTRVYSMQWHLNIIITVFVYPTEKNKTGLAFEIKIAAADHTSLRV
jgi:hypothetical protein